MFSGGTPVIEVIPAVSLRHHTALGIRWLDFPVPSGAALPWCPPALRTIVLNHLRDVVPRTVVAMKDIENIPVSEYLNPSSQEVRFWLDDTPTQPLSLSTWTPVHHFKRPAVLVTAVHVLRLGTAEVRNDLRERMMAAVRKLSPLVHFTILFGANEASRPAWASGEYFLVPTLDAVPAAMTNFVRSCARECVANVLARLRGMLVTHPEAIETDPNYGLPWESAQKGARSAQQLSCRVLKRKSDYLLQIGSMHCAFMELSDASSGPTIEENWAVGVLESLAAALQFDAEKFFVLLSRAATAATGSISGSPVAAAASPVSATSAPTIHALIESVASLEHRRQMSFVTKLVEKCTSGTAFLKFLLDASTASSTSLRSCAEYLKQEKERVAAGDTSVSPPALEACRALEKALVEEIDKILFVAQQVYSAGIKRNETLRELDLEVRLKRLVLWSEHRSTSTPIVLTTSLTSTPSSATGTTAGVVSSSSQSTVALTTFVRLLDELQTLAGRLPHEARTSVMLQAARLCEASGLHRRAVLMQFIAAFACLENQDARALAEVDALLSYCGAPFRIEPSTATLVTDTSTRAIAPSSSLASPLLGGSRRGTPSGLRQSRRIQTLAVHLAYQLAKGCANSNGPSIAGWQTLKCQLAGALVTTYAGFLRPEHIHPILDTIALTSANLPPAIQPWWQPLPILLSARPLPLPAARRPVVGEVARFFMTGAPRSWVYHRSRLFPGDMPVFVQGELYSVVVTLRNPFPYALQFDSIRLGNFIDLRNADGDRRVASAGAAAAAVAPYYEKVSVCDVLLQPKELIEVTLHGVCDDDCGFLAADSVEFFVSSKPRTGTLSLSTTEPMVIALPAPLSVPVVPPLPQLDGSFLPRAWTRLWCRQVPEPITLSLSNVGAQPIEVVQITMHFSYCRTASCMGCSNKRSNDEQHLVLCSRTDSGDVRDLRQGESAIIALLLTPPNAVPEVTTTNLVARVRYGSSVADPPPTKDWLKEQGVSDHDTVRTPLLMRELEVAFAVVCEPGPSISGRSLSADRRFVEVGVVNHNSQHPLVVRAALSYHPKSDQVSSPRTAATATVATWADGVTCTPKNELSIRVPIVETLFDNNERSGKRSVRAVVIAWEAAVVAVPSPFQAAAPLLPTFPGASASSSPLPPAIPSGSTMAPATAPATKVRGVLEVDVSAIVPIDAFTEIFSPETVLCTVVVTDAGGDNPQEEHRWFSFLARRPVISVTAVETLTLRVTLAAPTWSSVVPVQFTVAVDPPQAMIFGKVSSLHNLGDRGKQCVEVTVNAVLFFPGDYTLRLQATDTVSGTAIAFGVKMAAEHRARSIVARHADRLVR